MPRTDGCVAREFLQPLAKRARGNRCAALRKVMAGAAVFAVTLLVASYAPPSLARVNLDVHIGIPAPPAVVFPSEPQVVAVPDTHVYYVPGAPDYDMYRYGSYWYVNRDGYWYRARRYNGPFTYVEYGHVPYQIVRLPREYHHHPLRPHHPHGHHRDDHRR